MLRNNMFGYVICIVLLSLRFTLHNISEFLNFFLPSRICCKDGVVNNVKNQWQTLHCIGDVFLDYQLPIPWSKPVGTFVKRQILCLYEFKNKMEVYAQQMKNHVTSPGFCPGKHYFCIKCHLFWTSVNCMHFFSPPSRRQI